MKIKHLYAHTQLQRSESQLAVSESFLLAVSESFLLAVSDRDSCEPC